MTSGTPNPVATPTPPDEMLTLGRDDLDALLVSTRDLEGQSKYAVLLGPPGTGKTSSAVASLAPGQQVITYTMHIEGTAVEFTGHKEIRGGDTAYWEGIGVQAWRAGALLVINEIDNAGEDVLNYLYQLLDDPRIASIQLPDGEVVRPSPGFRVIATTNGRPEDIPAAIRDRFGVWLPYDEPSSAMYDRLDPDVRQVVQKIYRAACRAENARDRVPYVTYRQALSFCLMRRANLLKDVRDVARVILENDEQRAERFVQVLELVGGGAADRGAEPSALVRGL